MSFFKVSTDCHIQLPDCYDPRFALVEHTVATVRHTSSNVNTIGNVTTSSVFAYLLLSRFEQVVIIRWTCMPIRPFQHTKLGR